MKQILEWLGNREGEKEWFPVSVPGNIQHDYGIYKGFGDIHYADNVDVYRALEEDAWYYTAQFDVKARKGRRMFFVSEGIDYQCEIRLNGVLLCEHEGMFSRIEVELTENLREGANELEIRILPHPVGAYARGTGREEAAMSCKSAVDYGWDWHPRLLSSGLWQEAWLESRDGGEIGGCSVSYRLNEELDTAFVSFAVECEEKVLIQVFDREERCVYEGTDKMFPLKNVKLWWCNGQGEPYLYRYRVSSSADEKTGLMGFRTIELVMNGGSWEEPSSFPKSRSTPPVTIRLNGRKIFGMGSNWVRPELFPGTVTRETYEPLLLMAKDAHMNLLRCWGGSEIQKEDFYTLCDELGIMVWQEFPLACNAYPDEEHYLTVLKQEAEAVIRRLRRHPCLALWCGGNELFNKWSGMTDQSHALRLLNSLCYELDRDTPFIMTSPLMGMGHGGYLFREYDTGKDVFHTFSHSANTAYTEFGVPAAASPEYLKTFIPEEELFPPRKGGAWEKHHAFGVWEPESWLHLDILEGYFGKAASLEELCAQSMWLQCAGYQAIFEEARRQWPSCSMALNWCYNEPWKTAANNSIISYPCVPRPSYDAVASALRPVMPSARIPKFDWQEGELFWAELWLLNNSPGRVKADIRAYLELDGECIPVMRWETGDCEANENRRGHRVQWQLPRLREDHITLRLESEYGNSTYRLLYRRKERKAASNILNL